MDRATFIRIFTIFIGSGTTTAVGCGPGKSLMKEFALTDSLGVGSVKFLTSSAGKPVANADITLLTSNGSQSLQTDLTGTVVFTKIATGSRLVVGRPDGGKNIYTFQISGFVSSADLEVFLEPISATLLKPNTQLQIAPSAAEPAGSAFIVAPVSGSTVRRNPASPEGTARFNVFGKADSRLGQPGTNYHAYILVHPVAPSGLSGFFPQFPKLAIDPKTGTWITEAQIGPPTNDGDRFELTLVVTTMELQPGTLTNPLQFSAPTTVPGVVFVAPFIQDLVVKGGED